MINLFRSVLRTPAPELPGPGLRFRAAPDVKASLHSDGVVLIHTGKGTVFSANRVGAMIWDGATRQWTIEKVVRSISDAFEIPAQTVRQDAAMFLAQLEAEGLLISDAG